MKEKRKEEEKKTVKGEPPSQDKSMRYNLRKLTELPHHLARSHRQEVLNCVIRFLEKFLSATNSLWVPG